MNTVKRKSTLLLFLCPLLALTFSICAAILRLSLWNGWRNSSDISGAISRCDSHNLKAGQYPSFQERTESDRSVAGASPILLRNARIWTGARNGTEVIRGDLLLENGLIKGVGHISQSILTNLADDLVTIDVRNAWITPGLVDMHSHIGVSSTPAFASHSEGLDSFYPKVLIYTRDGT